jgi:small subunit ribosomal protein S21
VGSEGNVLMEVDVRNNNVDKALRILKKKLQQDGIFNELRNREHFVSKGEKRRKAQAAAKRRQEKAIQKRLEEFGF